MLSVAGSSGPRNMIWVKQNGIEKRIVNQVLRVLVADDSSAMRDRLRSMVSQVPRVGVVRLARDVTSALEAIRDEALDLIILDIQMPGGSGIDVLRAAKQSSPATKVIMLTSYPYRQYQDKCLELGADHFFSKSANSNDLLAVIENLAMSKGNPDDK
jgi:DNA-binding NarL/FixJ family response regulator